MRIAIVTHVVRHNDGQGRVNYEIARAALAEGHQVTLLASHVAPELVSETRLRWVAIKVGRFWPTKLFKQQVFALKTAMWLKKHKKEYDVLHVNGFISWAKADVNTAHFVHGGWLRSPYYPFKLTGGLWSAYQVIYSHVNATLEHWAYQRSKIIAAVSEKVAVEIRANGTESERIEVVYNGVDTSAFTAARRTGSDRSSFGLPADACLLLFVGDLRTPRKNLDTVLKALLQLPSNVHLAVAGYIPGSPYPDEAKALGVSDRVHFLGLVKNMPTLMHSVDAFVFPSRYEAMSLSLLEALAAGLPVITAKTAGGAEIIGTDCASKRAPAPLANSPMPLSCAARWAPPRACLRINSDGRVWPGAIWICIVALRIRRARRLHRTIQAMRRKPKAWPPFKRDLFINNIEAGSGI
jgi:glycosyltransferase involved in cell wall biosynthesis